MLVASSGTRARDRSPGLAWYGARRAVASETNPPAPAVRPPRRRRSHVRTWPRKLPPVSSCRVCDVPRRYPPDQTRLDDVAAHTYLSTVYIHTEARGRADERRTTTSHACPLHVHVSIRSDPPGPRQARGRDGPRPIARPARRRFLVVPAGPDRGKRNERLCGLHKYTDANMQQAIAS